MDRLKLAVSGSISFDQLLKFAGEFGPVLRSAPADKVSLSFLATEMTLSRGGTGGNISLALARLNQKPLLLGAVGKDFNEGYSQFLSSAGVDLSGVLVSETQGTARFLCTTDAVGNQLATFYAGAMTEASKIDVANGPRFDLLLVTPDDPKAMVQHTQTARSSGLAFAADPSQQLAVLTGDQIVELISGASFLFANETEDALIRDKTGLTKDQVAELVAVQVITWGAKGVSVYVSGADEKELFVPALADIVATDPTGCGDAFRGGFLAGHANGLSLEDSARLGNAVASYVVEVEGAQEYSFTRTDLLTRHAGAYGNEAAAAVANAMGWAL